MTNKVSKSMVSLVASAVVALGACSGSHPAQPASPDAATEPDAAVTPVDLTARAARAICGALFRCCEDDVEAYFAAYRGNELLAAFRDQLPPAVTLDEVGCRAVLEPMLDIVPIGDWVRAATAGTVEYDEAAAASCVAALDAATCGEPARAALWDSTCFGFSPPIGGVERRSYVRRTRGVDATCGPIRDGIGAALYGTCDPTSAFCCYEEPTRPGCQYPFDADGNPRSGRCQAITPVGAACAITAPLQLCATGVDCDTDTLTCVAPVDADLAVGALCIDEAYHLLGECQASFCDLFGSRRCEPLRPDGEACTGGDECTSHSCQSVCVPQTLCTGMPDEPPPPPPDAGIDAGPPDGAATSNESCATAPGLVTSSVVSPLSGYTSRISGAFGATNDYNPLMSSGLPPQCAYAYDARGRDVVYAITLAPGDRLRLRAELADGKQGGIYLLDSCPGASWPDFDGSGACGSNEYGAGFCGPVGCDPAVLDITYPTMLGGQPTTAATFWLVVDQVGGDDSTGYVVDWQLIH